MISGAQDGKSQLRSSQKVSKQTTSLTVKAMYEGKLLDRAIRDNSFLLKLGVEQDYAMRRQILSGAAQQLLAVAISPEVYTIPVSGIDKNDKSKVYSARVTPSYKDGICSSKHYFLENVNGKDIMCTACGSGIGEALIVSFCRHKPTKKTEQ